MLDKIFSNTKYLEKGLDAAWTRNQVISNNIANADTPGFKGSKVEFESVFKNALQDADSGFTTKLTRDKHMSFDSDIADVSPSIVENGNTTMRADGNNVDIDYENAELAKNQLYYDTLLEKVSSQFSRLKTAITEGK